MQEFGAPVAQKPPTMRRSGSPECASESNAATLKSPLQRVAILILDGSPMLGGIIGQFLPIVAGGFLIVAGPSGRVPNVRDCGERWRSIEHGLTLEVVWLSRR